MKKAKKKFGTFFWKIINQKSFNIVEEWKKKSKVLKNLEKSS